MIIQDSAGNAIGLRNCNKFVTLNNVVITAQTAIWTPAAGKKFKLMGYILTAGVVAGNVILQDGASTTVFLLPFSAIGQTIGSGGDLGAGIISATAGNALNATGASTQTLSGTLFGIEE
jgi:hypothetical protein